MTPEELKKEIVEALEKKIRADYTGIVSKEQIQATIDWWNAYLLSALARYDHALESKKYLKHHDHCRN